MRVILFTSVLLAFSLKLANAQSWLNPPSSNPLPTIKPKPICTQEFSQILYAV